MRYLVAGDGKAFGLNENGTWMPAPSSGSALGMLQAKPLTPAIVDSVRGLFGSLGIQVTETGEELTCTHRGDAVEFRAGIDRSSVDFLVPLHLYQVERLAGFFTDGVLDDLEMFYVTRTLFAFGSGPRHLTGNPLVANPVLRRIIRGKRLLHITLVSPDPAADHDALFTMAFVASQWIVVGGHHGVPERVLVVPVSEAIELQRVLFAGMKASDLGTWIKIARAYTAWRARVEVPLPPRSESHAP